MPEPLLTALFTYALTLNASQLAMGLIVSMVFGFTAGNYACSLVHRLPRGLGVLDKKPYCGSCQTMLATKDLFPVFSAFFLRHKCRYCSAPIPKTHFYTELALGALFCLGFAKWGFSEQYVLVVVLGSMLTVLASIHHNDSQIDRRVLIAILVIGALYRVLVDASIFPAFLCGLYAVITAALLWKKDIQKIGHVYMLPPHALIFITGAIIAGEAGLLTYLINYIILFGLSKLLTNPIPYTTPFSLALIMALLLG